MRSILKRTLLNTKITIMWATLKIGSLILLTGIILIVSCKKEYSCEGCADKNKPPIAIAGPDLVITLPTDSIFLDGRNSTDPDGTISNWLWTKISGPASFVFNNSSAQNSVIKNLVKGIYQVELKVTDNGGLSGRDTMQIIVNDPSQPNRPPVACAGIDQTITLPVSIVNLDGRCSTDPDNNITSYAWAKISGPSSAIIANPGAIQTPVNNLAEGIYLFELKVTDAGGLFSKDTVQIIVSPIETACPGNRPVMNLQLTPVGSLSVTRGYMAAASAGNKILFAGGSTGEQDPGLVLYSRVDIYDISTETWSTSELSEARTGIGAVAVGNKILFAGGAKNFDYNNWGWSNFSTRVDIFDVLTNTWTTTELPEPQAFLWSYGTAVAAGNKAYFTCQYNGSSFVHIYDPATNSWSNTQLPERRTFLTGASVENKILYAGGINADSYSNRVDKYDASNNTWYLNSLSEARRLINAVTLNNKVFFAGGQTAPGNHTNRVDIYDNTTQSWSSTCLSRNTILAGAAFGGHRVCFFEGTRVDIFDTSSNSWFINDLNISVVDDASIVISAGNDIYIAGGKVNNAWTNQVWRVQF